MIGTSAERVELRDEVDARYSESLRIEGERAQEAERLTQLETTMLRRRSLLVEEPLLEDPSVRIAVRHCREEVGLVFRRFLPEDTFASVQLWIESLSPEPEKFYLVNFTTRVLPSVTVYSGTFTVVRENDEVQETMVAEEVERDELLFSEDENEENDISHQPQSPPSRQQSPPSRQRRVTRQPTSLTNIYDVSDDDDDDALQKVILLGVEEKKGRFQLAIQAEAEVEAVRRQAIIQDMTGFLKNIQKLETGQGFTFKDEQATGDGVSRDVISEFIECVTATYVGHAEKVPSLAQEEEEIEALGKAITLGYLQHSMFPLVISKAALKYYLLGDCTDDDLFESFLNFLPGTFIYLTLTNRSTYRINPFLQKDGLIFRIFISQ